MESGHVNGEDGSADEICFPGGEQESFDISRCLEFWKKKKVSQEGRPNYDRARVGISLLSDKRDGNTVPPVSIRGAVWFQTRETYHTLKVTTKREERLEGQQRYNNVIK